MRYLIDTNIFIYLVCDRDSITSDVRAILEDASNLLYMSMESVRELLVAYRKKKLLLKVWRTPREMVRAIECDASITILPVGMDVMHTLSELQINEAQRHNDPSDHIIISQAISMGIPLISSDRKFAFYRSQGLDFIFNEC